MVAQHKPPPVMQSVLYYDSRVENRLESRARICNLRHKDPIGPVSNYGVILLYLGTIHNYTRSSI